MKGTASGHYSMAMAGRNGCGNQRETEARHLSVRMMMMRRYECNLESDQGDKSDVGRATAESMGPSYARLYAQRAFRAKMLVI